jgi:hypothetical protein
MKKYLTTNLCSLFDFVHDWPLTKSDGPTGRFTIIRISDECVLGFRFTVVMYRGHILAEWENIFDIADIDGNRRGVRTFFTPSRTRLDLHRLPAFSVLSVCISLPATWEGNEEKPNIVLQFDACRPFTSVSNTCENSPDVEMMWISRPPETVVFTLTRLLVLEALQQIQNSINIISFTRYFQDYTMKRREFHAKGLSSFFSSHG